MKKLFVPERINLQREYVKHMGGREMRRFALAALPGILAAALAWQKLSLPTARLTALLLALVYIAVCYALFARIDGAGSMYDYLCRIARFLRAQKKYFYLREEGRHEK